MTDVKREFATQFPASDFEEKHYIFSKEELSLIIAYQGIQAAHTHSVKTAEEAVNRILNLTCLPRVGVAVNPSVGMFYDTGEGTFTVFVPRKYCDFCKERAARVRYEGKAFCPTCFELEKMKTNVSVPTAEAQPTPTE